MRRKRPLKALSIANRPCFAALRGLSTSLKVLSLSMESEGNPLLPHRATSDYESI